MQNTFLRQVGKSESCRVLYLMMNTTANGIGLSIGFLSLTTPASMKL